MEIESYAKYIPLIAKEIVPTIVRGRREDPLKNWMSNVSELFGRTEKEISLSLSRKDD